MISHEVRALVESLDVEQILPQDYAQYKPLFIEGLCFFFERLPERRLSAIFMQQFALAPETSFADRVLNLLHQCPTLHKLGQIVARDRRLSLQMRRTLQRLETIRPNGEYQWPSRDLLNKLRGIQGIELASRPLAEASVAVILPFVWRKGPDAIQRGVFKLLKPEVEERLHEELEIWEELGVFLEERCEHHDLPVLDYRETLASMRQSLRQEVCFDREQNHLIEASNFYKDEPSVVIPRLLPFCSSQVTAMDRIDGRRVTDAQLSQKERRQLADTLIRTMIAMPFWNPEQATPFHADPHAGNLFFTQDNKLAIFDWTLVGRLDKRQRANLMQMVLGGMFHDEARICQAVEDLGRTQPKVSKLRTCVSAALKEIRQGQFPGFNWSQRLLDNVALSNTMGFAENLILFRKALLTLSSVVADIADNPSIDRIMLNSGLRSFCAEVPSRFLTNPGSNSFATHLSNIDLLALWGSSPSSATTYWVGVWQDCLDLIGGSSS